MTFEGLIAPAFGLPACPLSAGTSCAQDILKKNKLTRLKAATNKDLDHLDAILPSKFAAKIGGEGQIMKIRLKNWANPAQDAFREAASFLLNCISCNLA